MDVIVKIESFKSIEHYFHESSCTHRLKQITKPIFFLNANDDPIMGNKMIPIDKCYDNILLGVTKAGGHVGYFEGMLWSNSQWFPRPIFEFLNYFVKKEEALKKVAAAAITKQQIRVSSKNNLLLLSQ